MPDKVGRRYLYYTLGVFTHDHEYVSGLGDLEDCDCCTSVTPEFPPYTYC